MTQSTKLGTLTVNEGIISQDDFDTNVLPITNRIDNIEIDISEEDKDLSSTIDWQYDKGFNENLEVVDMRGHQCGTIDVKKYRNKDFKFWAYKWCGFRCEDGTLKEIMNCTAGDKIGGGPKYEVTIPSDAITFCITTGMANSYYKYGQVVHIEGKTSIIQQKINDSLVPVNEKIDSSVSELNEKVNSSVSKVNERIDEIIPEIEFEISVDQEEELIQSLDDVLEWESGLYWDEKLRKISHPSFSISEVDVSEYTGKTIMFHAYGIKSGDTIIGACGFRLNDGTLSDVGPYDHYNMSQEYHSLKIPKNAITFCITTGSGESYVKLGNKIVVPQHTSTITKKINSSAIPEMKEYTDSKVKSSFGELDKKIDEVRTEIVVNQDARDIDLSSEVVWQENKAFVEATLQKVDSNKIQAGELDVSKYVGEKIEFWVYGSYGFRDSEGNVLFSATDKTTHFDHRQEKIKLDIPEGAVTFCLTTGMDTPFAKDGQIVHTSPRKCIIDDRIDNAFAKVNLNDLPNIVKFNKEFGFDSYNEFQNTKKSIVIGGAIVPNASRNFLNNIDLKTTYEIARTDDPFLNKIGIEHMLSKKNGFAKGTQLSFNMVDQTSSGIEQLIIDNKDKRLVFVFYIFSRNKEFPLTTSRFYTNELSLQTSSCIIEDTESEFVKKYILKAPTNNLTDLTQMKYLCFDIKGQVASYDYSAADYGFTGFGVGVYDSEEEENEKPLIGDWQTISLLTDMPATKEYVKSDEYADYIRKVIKQDPSGSLPFNDVELARKKLAAAIKIVNGKGDIVRSFKDKYNRAVVSFNGDSIFGSQLDDLTKVDEYESGEFPPNMSRVNIPRKFFDKYRFPDEDVKFRNLKHSEWTRTGFDINTGDDKNYTFNCIETFGGNVGDTAEITVSGSKFVKFIWSEYKGQPYSFKIWQSTDNSYYEELKTIEVTNNRRIMIAYDIIEIDSSKTYNFKIEILSGNQNNVTFWGIETWSNPRLDVVVEAFSGTGTTHAISLGKDAYYCQMHRPQIIVMDVLQFNDWPLDLNDWIENSSKIYNYCKEKGVPVLAVGCWSTEGTSPGPHPQTFLGVDVCKQNDIFAVDMDMKIHDEQYAPATRITGADGLHLSNYGVGYFFEEIERIFG